MRNVANVCSTRSYAVTIAEIIVGITIYTSPGITLHTWIQSVPPAVVGGYVVDRLGQMLRMHPPATAGGTDCIQVGRGVFARARWRRLRWDGSRHDKTRRHHLVALPNRQTQHLQPSQSAEDVHSQT